MGTARSSHLNRLQAHADLIFGPGFDRAWFATQYERGGEGMLQVLSGAFVNSKGKGYVLMPPILFPYENGTKRDIFLNPSLIRVSCLIYLSAT